MNTVTKHALSNPWYKQPWLLFVISIPLCSIILSSIMIYVAVAGRDSLVSDNYYKDGMAINQTIEQDQLADQLGLRPIVTIDQNGLIRVELDAQQMAQQPFLTLKLLHPTVAAEDHIVQLLPTSSGFVGELPTPVSGRRYLDLYSHDQSWRIREEITLPLAALTLNLR